MVVIGSRVVEPGNRSPSADPAPTDQRPMVSIYDGPTVSQRALILAAMREAGSSMGVRSFTSTVIPNRLLGESWAEVILSRTQVNRRNRLRRAGQPALDEIEEGVITGANRVRPGDRELLSQATIRELDSSGSGGIFVLKPAELADLGPLNARERALVRGVINTRDVFPYAAVLPTAHSVYLYLAKTEVPPDLDLEDVQNLRFPDGMPAVERHLVRFRPILERKVRAYNERRPWWCLHRPRPGIEAHQGSRETWANYGVTARWGLGGRLTVALAPRSAAPADGLHALLPSEGAPAEYLVALLNSTAVQEVADTVPPGQLRKGDLIQLGIPRLDSEAVRVITMIALQLADLVVEIVSAHGMRFVELPESLRHDLTLASIPDAVWAGREELPSVSGRLADVPWVREVGGSRVRQQIQSVSREDTLLGSHIRLEAKSGHNAFVDLSDPTDELLDVLEARLRGLGAAGGRLSDVPDVIVPLDQSRLIDAYADDRQILHAAVDGYRTRREEVDAIIAAHV